MLLIREIHDFLNNNNIKIKNISGENISIEDLEAECNRLKAEKEFIEIEIN